MGSHFADQCSNLDLRFGNGRHRMDEYQRYPQPTEPLVCQPAFSGDHRACDLSYDGSNLRKGCNRIHSAHKYRSAQGYGSDGDKGIYSIFPPFLLPY